MRKGMGTPEIEEALRVSVCCAHWFTANRPDAGRGTDRHTMTSSTITAVNHNEPMDPPHPRADGPPRRRAVTASDKIAHLHAYEQACEHGEGGAYLRRGGVRSPLVGGGRAPGDAGVLAGKRPGEKVGRLTAEQAEIARLTRELA